MKQTHTSRLLLFVVLLLVSGWAFAQSGSVATMPVIDAQLNSSTGVIKGAPKKYVTNTTFNHFAAKRQAYYLSGATNLSLFKNFAIADVTAGTLQVGQNFALVKEEALITNVLTVAVQSNIANNVANLVSTNKLANDLGIPLSWTHFFVGVTGTGIDSADIDALNRNRAFQYALLRGKLAAETALIDKVSSDAAMKSDAQVQLIKKATADFYAAELAALEEQVPSFHTLWLRLQGFVPLTSSTYQVAPVGSLDFQKQNTRKWSAGASLGGVYENFWRWGGIFLNGSARVLRTNAVEQQTGGIQQYTQYVLLTTPAPAGQLYSSGAGDKVYVGELREAWTAPLQVQFIYLLPSRGDSKIGVDVQMERYAINYTKTNLLLGIPLFLKGSGENGVNVEAQFKFRDVDKSINGSDRFTVGLSVALPFGSTIK